MLKPNWMSITTISEIAKTVGPAMSSYGPGALRRSSVTLLISEICIADCESDEKSKGINNKKEFLCQIVFDEKESTLTLIERITNETECNG